MGPRIEEIERLLEYIAMATNAGEYTARCHEVNEVVEQVVSGLIELAHEHRRGLWIEVTIHSRDGAITTYIDLFQELGRSNMIATISINGPEKEQRNYLCSVEIR